jgi:nitrogen regulatory protein P-II 1
MHEIKAIIRPDRLEAVVQGLHGIPGLPGVTVSRVEGVGRLRSAGPEDEGFGRTEMVKLEIVVSDALVGAVTEAIERAACTSRAGDGKIFVLSVEEAIQVRSGERGEAAL